MQPQCDVVTGTKLVHKPADAIGIRCLMARHDMEGFTQREHAGLGDRVGQPAVLIGIVAVRDGVWIDTRTPRTVAALVRVLQLPGMIAHHGYLVLYMKTAAHKATPPTAIAIPIIRVSSAGSRRHAAMKGLYRSAE